MRVLTCSASDGLKSQMHGIKQPFLAIQLKHLRLYSEKYYPGVCHAAEKPQKLSPSPADQFSSEKRPRYINSAFHFTPGEPGSGGNRSRRREPVEARFVFFI